MRRIFRVFKKFIFTRLHSDAPIAENIPDEIIELLNGDAELESLEIVRNLFDEVVSFAREEPELYRLLFLTHDAGEKGAMDAMRHSLDYVKEPLERIYHISKAEAERYFRDLWIVVYGIAALIVTGDCPYSDAEIGAILTGFSLSICKAIKEIPGFVSGDFDRDRLFTEMIGGCKNG